MEIHNFARGNEQMNKKVAVAFEAREIYIFKYSKILRHSLQKNHPNHKLRIHDNIQWIHLWEIQTWIHWEKLHSKGHRGLLSQSSKHPTF